MQWLKGFRVWGSGYKMAICVQGLGVWGTVRQASVSGSNYNTTY